MLIIPICSCTAARSQNPEKPKNKVNTEALILLVKMNAWCELNLVCFYVFGLVFEACVSFSMYLPHSQHCTVPVC